MPGEDTTAPDPEELASLPEFYHPCVDRAGENVAFYYDEHGRNDLYLLDWEARTHWKVTSGEVPRNARWPIQWRGDGTGVFFHLDEDGDEQNDIGIWHRSGETDVAVEVDGQGILLDSTRDSRWILFASDAGEQLNVYRYDTEKQACEQLTSYDSPVMQAVYGPDDDRIAYVTNATETLENRDVFVMTAAGCDKRRLSIGGRGSQSRVAAWFPDGERLLISDNAQDLRRVGIYELSEDTIEWLGPHEAEESAIDVSPSGGYVLATRTRRGATMPVLYDMATKEGRELDLPDGVSSFGSGRTASFVTDTTVVFAHSRAAARKEMLAYDLCDHERSVLLPAAYGDIDSGVFFDAEYVTYQSEDGLEIGGLLYDPRETTDETGEHPGVVIVHGGPHSRASKRFDLYAQFLATRGYGVFQPNYRGSTGRGRAFKEAIHGDWGGMEQADIAAGGRWLKARPWIDEDRVAVFGGSYGGYSVYCQLTQYPALWATGVAWIGITDLHRLYEEDMPHFQYLLREQMGDPEENYALWRERSPIEHVDRLERPIYMIHGVTDVRCPIEQARLFKDALVDRGWEEDEDFAYTELEAEGHGSTDIDQKVRMLRHLDAYLTEWL